METPEILAEAVSIARNARAKAERAHLETTLDEFERSEHRSLRSLAHVYRMLQRPPQF